MWSVDWSTSLGANLCSTCVTSSNWNQKSIFSGMKKVASVCFKCLKLIIPSGKLWLQSKYPECFIYSFTACLDRKVLRLLSLPYNTDLQAHSWLMLSDFRVNWEAANQKRIQITKKKKIHRIFQPYMWFGTVIFFLFYCLCKYFIVSAAFV